MRHGIRRREKISSNAAREMILLIAKKGKHSLYGRLVTDEDVIHFSERLYNKPFSKLVEELREYSSPIPFPFSVFELVSMHVNASKAALIDMATGEEIVDLKYGEICKSVYINSFYESLGDFEESIQKPSYMKFRDALVDGVESIEAYFIHRVEIFNRSCNIEDRITLTGRINWEDRLDKWIPIMTGKVLNKCSRNYNHFIELKKIRNELHPTTSISSIDYNKYVKMLNRYKSGIAGFLVDLHLLFNEPIPFLIIKTMFYPKIEIRRSNE